MSTLDNQVALVTGGARGIGAATARRLADGGARVAIVDLDESAAEAAADELGGGTIGIGADVRDADAVNAAVQRVVDTFGGLHILVNNAGVTRDNLLFRLTEDDWDTVIEVHLRGAFLMSRAAQQHFVSQRYGRIISLSSVSALGTRGQANYAAAKMGLQGLTRTLAIELGPFGVTVNAVAPGFIMTDMTNATAERLGVTPEQLRQSSADATPMRRVGRPTDIADVIAFFADPATSFVTGQTLYVDGGARI